MGLTTLLMFHTSLAPPAVDGYLPRLTRRRFGGMASTSVAIFAFRVWLWVCGTIVMVALARSPGCPSRHEPARSPGFPIPADNFDNELARVRDFVGKSPAWRGLDAAFFFSLSMAWEARRRGGHHSPRLLAQERLVPAEVPAALLN